MEKEVKPLFVIPSEARDLQFADGAENCRFLVAFAPRNDNELKGLEPRAQSREPAP